MDERERDPGWNDWKHDDLPTSNHRNDEGEEEEEECIESTGSGKGRGIEIARRIQALGIRLDYWRTKEKKWSSAVGVSTGNILSTEAPVMAYRDIPFDIASCILLHMPDLETLGTAILVNTTFASSFTTAHTSITRHVVLTMFGEEVIDRALLLAALLNHDGPIEGWEGELVLPRPDLSVALDTPSLRTLMEIYKVTNIWIELWQTQQLWLYTDQPFPKRIDLPIDSKYHLRRSITLLWVFAACYVDVQASYPDNGATIFGWMNNRIFGYFNHFDLLLTVSLDDFMTEVVDTVCSDGIRNIRDFSSSRTQSHVCHARGPAWMLRLIAPGKPIKNLGPNSYQWGLFGPRSTMEMILRGIIGPSAGFTGEQMEKMIEDLRAMGLDGNDGALWMNGSDSEAVGRR